MQPALKHLTPLAGLAAFIVAAFVLLVEPALANKFETIGGGFSGSSGIKREWLVKFFLAAGGISLLAGVLALIVPHRNALFLNFSNWKASAVVLFILAAIFLTIAGVL